MQMTNRGNLPAPVVLAVENDSYSKGASHYSITELLKPPRVKELERRHDAELTRDVADSLWSLFGQVAHGILERAGKSLSRRLNETRLAVTIDGLTVSAQIDTLCLENHDLDDYKFVTAWKIKKGKATDADWTAQLNMQRYILKTHGHRVDRLWITALFRDWSVLEAKRSEDYPQTGGQRVPIEVWSDDQTVAFMRERIRLHEQAKKAKDQTDMPECGPEERWEKPSSWAVMKGTRAIRFGVCFSEQAAKDTHARNPGTRIEYRPGVSTRCEFYCPVKEKCLQYRNKIHKGEKNGNEIQD